MPSEHKRTKLGHLPGEISLGWLMALREGRGEYEADIGFGVVLDERDGRSIRRHLKTKGHVVQRRRDRRATLAGLGEL